MKNDTRRPHNNKPTVAFCIRGIGSGAGTEIWKGITFAVKNADAHLITLYGGVLGKAQGNVIYDFIQKGNVDGVISWASSDNNEFTRYYDKFRGIPLITLSLHLPGYPSVSIDSYSGMKAAMDHLTKDHGYKKIAFIRGPEHHIYAVERFQAYLDSLKENNIPYDETLVTDFGNFRPDDGVKAYKQFIRDQKLQPGRDLEAVVGVSDQSVVAFMELAKQDGYDLPRELALTGCNYSDAAISSDPGITSVSMPFFEQGVKAVELTLDMIQGRQIPESTLLPAKLVKLQSCGCTLVGSVVRKNREGQRLSILKISAKTAEQDLLDETQQRELPQRIADRVADRIESVDINHSMIEQYSRKLVYAFCKADPAEGEREFLGALAAVLRATLRQGGRTDSWHEMLTMLSEAVGQSEARAENIIEGLQRLEKGRLIVSEYVKREYFSMYADADWRINRLRDISARMFEAGSLEQLEQVLASRIFPFGINGYFVCLYKNPVSYTFMDPLPEISTLVMGKLAEGACTSAEGVGSEFCTAMILPDALIQKIGTLNILVLPLFQQDVQIGYIILKDTPIRNHMYQMFGDLLSSSIHNINLFREIEGVKRELEKTLVLLKNKAGIISGNSRDISTRVNEISRATGESALHISEISENISRVLSITREAVTLGGKVNSLISTLRDQSLKIGSFSDVIFDIAQQTNVLSINAAIESARAGDMGRGFAIVAREIKELSRKTVVSTEDINQMIALIQESTNTTVRQLESMINIVETISDHSQTITDAIQKQSQSITSISGLLSEAAKGSDDIAREISDVARVGGDA
ncbi:MAG: substrate-binding domain-containing protein [Spirochaetales bacterium]|nr:substrate-binding domain-containing protein [Spirochaetales bacterium]